MLISMAQRRFFLCPYQCICSPYTHSSNTFTPINPFQYILRRCLEYCNKETLLDRVRPGRKSFTNCNAEQNTTTTQTEADEVNRLNRTRLPHIGWRGGNTFKLPNDSTIIGIFSSSRCPQHKHIREVSKIKLFEWPTDFQH